MTEAVDDMTSLEWNVYNFESAGWPRSRPCRLRSKEPSTEALTVVSSIFHNDETLVPLVWTLDAILTRSTHRPAGDGPERKGSAIHILNRWSISLIGGNPSVRAKSRMNGPPCCECLQQGVSVVAFVNNLRE